MEYFVLYFDTLYDIHMKNLMYAQTCIEYV